GVVGADDAIAACHERRQHLAVQIRPGGLSVEADHGIALPLVQVVHPEAVDLHVVGVEVVAGQLVEALVGRAEDVHFAGIYPARVIFRQVTHDDLGCASYFVGDYSAGVAAVVDPRLEIGPYLELARYLSVEIAHVVETHNHADHVSGHGRLTAATGAPIHIHRACETACR